MKYTSVKNSYYGFFSKDDNVFSNIGEVSYDITDSVTHWMPLPAPPDEI